MTTTAVFGCTGAVGSHILTTLLGDSIFGPIKTISRRLPKQESPKLEATQETDTSKWSGMIAALNPKPTVIFNAVGTTRAQAGSLAEQWKIDHDLCVENIKAAKQAGVKTYLYISGGGTRGLLSRYVPYSQMKIGVEDAIREAGFEHGIVLRPGMIIGNREQPKSIFLETFIGNLHRISLALQDMIGNWSFPHGRFGVRGRKG
ncbi:serine/threonine kinase TIP30/CC3 [Dissoconium aciculare CBS 342.82]|uniref:Serine/threonine kinase TIP30/CC3 n=1 Tax=Dissoconium aciculare CBS 342.82 TaxID=1314786 RepID=A0A6J3M8X5_9PEZI|nr:serine/threonine kinase TIP30/CC3 [Dissoconium aciculare CBS 342.82]KAF1824328.1 serine/threonine kinase TIP30/CC3 [Dissoconium aciculare CBS 342.82]